MVKLLLANEKVNSLAKDNEALICAATFGHLEIVKLLFSVKGANPSAKKNRAVRFALISGYMEVVKFLLTDQRVFLHANDSLTFCHTVNRGRYSKSGCKWTCRSC